MLKKIAIAFCILVFALSVVIVLAVQPVFVAEKAAPQPPVSTAALEGHVRMLTETFHPRSYDKPENIEAAARYIEEHFKATGARVSRQTFRAEGKREYANIIAVYGPETGPALVVGAHYDSCYADEAGATKVYTPGADDNASGMAGLLALGSLLGQNPPAGQVQLVAFCLEEPPFFGTEYMGSYVHAAKLAKEGAEIRGMITLEMIGYFSDEKGSQRYPIKALGLLYPDTGNYLGLVGRFQDMGLTRAVKAAMQSASDLPVLSVNGPAMIPGIDYSDHRNYWEYGYTAIMVTDTAYFRNPHYHTLEDSAETLDYGRMAKVVQGLYAAVMKLAGK